MMKYRKRVLRAMIIWATCLCSMHGSADAFILGGRWTRTATDGPGLAQGDAITLTWGFIPDGTAIPGYAGSNVISFLDNVVGAGPGGTDLTQRPWFTLFEQSFNRWSEVSGLSYVYEPSDDGRTHLSFAGFEGVRADLRIGGTNIDGSAGSVLAFNQFPNSGDMVIDTSESSFFGNSFNNYIRLRNTVMHEHGHGLGLEHVESDAARFLMEPFIQLNFDGPQLDDILGAHRGYGDFYEKSNAGAGNDVASNATSLGTVFDQMTVSIGTDGDDRIVAANETDFVSIDDNSDTDFYAFTVSERSRVDIELTPTGSSYLVGPQNGSQITLDNRIRSDLALALFDSDQTTLLTSVDLTGEGEIESINDWLLGPPGEYYVRVTGAANDVQMYQLDVTARYELLLDGDFNGDGNLNDVDVDALVAEIAGGGVDPGFDLTGDGQVNGADLTEWLALAGGVNLPSQNSYVYGDANLDGVVDTSDFNLWNSNKFSQQPAWSRGDFNADGVIDASDFNTWNANKFTVADSSGANVVPEPSALLLVCLALGAWLGRCRVRQ